MHSADIEQILESLCDADEGILLAMLVSDDGLPLCHVGSAEDFDMTSALYIELKLICDRVLAELHMGDPEHIFIRARAGCVDIRPVPGIGVLACMATASINTRKLQVMAWKAVSSLLKAS